MPEEYLKTNMSLRQFSSIMGLKGITAKIEEEQIDRLMNELKKGNYIHIDQFEAIVDDLLNNVLENIKSYAEKDEEEKIRTIHLLIKEFFNYHIFNNDSGSLKHIKVEFEKDIQELIKKLKEQNLNEERIVHGKRSMNWWFKSMISRDFHLEEKTIHDAKTEIDLEEEELEIHTELNRLKSLIDGDKSDMSSEEQKKIDDEIKEKLIKFAEILFQEYKALFDAEIDAEIQEADLIHDIDEIIRFSRHNLAIVDRLNKIKQKIETHCKEDINHSKQMLLEAHVLETDMDN